MSDYLQPLLSETSISGGISGVFDRCSDISEQISTCSFRTQFTEVAILPCSDVSDVICEERNLESSSITSASLNQGNRCAKVNKQDSRIPTEKSDSSRTESSGSLDLQTLQVEDDSVTAYAVFEVAPAFASVSTVEEAMQRHSNEVLNHKCYHGSIDAVEAARRLRPYLDGTFLLRDSSRGLWTLSVQTELGVQHVRLKVSGEQLQLEAMAPEVHQSSGINSLLKQLKKITALRKCYIRVKNSLVRVTIKQGLQKP